MLGARIRAETPHNRLDRLNRLVSCGAGFCAAAEKVKTDLACETHLKFHFASLLSTQLIISRCQNSTANTT